MLGSGNVATQLTRSLKKSGHTISQVYSRSIDNAKDLARITNCAYTNKKNEIDPSADLYILAIPDAAISSVANSLVGLKGIVVHTSGSTPLSTLKGTSDHTGVFYPFQTFTKSRDIDLDKVPFCIEANSEEVKEILFKLAKSVGGNPIEMESEMRQWLHLAGVFSCNFVNHMLTISELIAEERGIDFELLKPLVNETIQKALSNKPSLSQTGPAIRGDAETIKRHTALISSLDDELRELYTTISSSIWNLKKSTE